MGDFSKTINLKNKNKKMLCAFVCFSLFKETRGLHSVQRSRVPTNGIKGSCYWEQIGNRLGTHWELEGNMLGTKEK